MELTILERMLALGLLPEQGNMLMLRTRAGLVAKVGLSAEELTEYEVKQEGGSIKWRDDLPQTKDIDLSSAELAVLQEALVKKNERKELVPAHMTLYEKLVERGE